MRQGRSLLSEVDQGATFVELFFDLVFVFAITELTRAIATDLTWHGIGRAVVVFWLVWWAWTQFTWALNPADADHPGVRVTTLLATGLAFVMAASVHSAFDDGSGAWFALPYIAVRLTGMAVHFGLGRSDADLMRAVRIFSTFSIWGLVAVGVGAFVSPGARGWWWLGGIALDLLAAGVGGRAQTSAKWQVKPKHFVERHGLFVIIALGESLVVAGTTSVGSERTFELAVVALSAVAITCLLWWTYFGWLHPAFERALVASDEDQRAPMARDAFSVLHFPLIGGVIGIAVAFEEGIAHPTDAMHSEVVAALAIGLVLFLGSATAAHARLVGQILITRGLATIALATLLLALGEPTPTAAFLTVTVALALIVGSERRHRADAQPPGTD